MPVLLLAFLAVFVVSNRSKPAGPSAVAWTHDLDTALAEAGQSERLVFAEFYATWCQPCQWMDARVFTQQDVANALDGYIPVKIDIDKNKELTKKIGVEGYPTMVIFSADGKVLDFKVGALDVDEFIDWVKNKPSA